jgi:transposase InsO family protein
MLKTIDSEGVVYYDKTTIKLIYESGYHLTNDLLPFYHMLSYLKKYANLSKEAKQRLKWMDYYYQCENVSLTCRHFDIPRKTFYKWFNRYEPNNLFTLEDQSRAPVNKRQKEITSEQEMRVVQLRKQHICYSKIKLAKIYLREYGEPISSWKIQYTIVKYKLYPNPRKTAKITRKRLSAVKKKRITELKKKPKNGFLVCLDAIELRCNNLKRYIFTGIDSFSKVAFARMYRHANSYNADDFLNRLMYLTNGQIENIQTDNGSEFEKHFRHSCERINLNRYFSRPRTPKDNPVNERFNRTLQEEFVNLGNFTPDVVQFNSNLTKWLIEYNFYRPHDSLNNETPININNSIKVSPMYPSGTKS